MDADRLAVAAALLALVLAAGCLGGGGERGLRVTGIDGDWTEESTLELRVTVVNTGSTEATGTVLVRAEVDGGETYVEGREVTLSASGTETVVVVFEPPADAVGSGFDANARLE